MGLFLPFSESKNWQEFLGWRKERKHLYVVPPGWLVTYIELKLFQLLKIHEENREGKTDFIGVMLYRDELFWCGL